MLQDEKGWEIYREKEVAVIGERKEKICKLRIKPINSGKCLAATQEADGNLQE